MLLNKSDVEEVFMELNKELLRQIPKSERRNILCGVSYLSKCGSNTAKEMFEELKKMNYGKKGDKLLYVPKSGDYETSKPSEEVLYMLYGNVKECLKYARVLRKQDAVSDIQINVCSEMNPMQATIAKQYNIVAKEVSSIFQAFAKLSLLKPHPNMHIVAMFLPVETCGSTNLVKPLMSMTSNLEIVNAFSKNFKAVTVLVHVFSGEAEKLYASLSGNYTIETFGEKTACKHFIEENYTDIIKDMKLVFVGKTELNKSLCLMENITEVVTREEVENYIADDVALFLDSDYICEDIVVAYEVLKKNPNQTIFINTGDYEPVYKLVKPILDEVGGKNVYSFGNFDKIYRSYFKK